MVQQVEMTLRVVHSLGFLSIFVRRNVLVRMKQTGHHIVPFFNDCHGWFFREYCKMSDMSEIPTSTDPR